MPLPPPPIFSPIHVDLTRFLHLCVGSPQSEAGGEFTRTYSYCGKEREGGREGGKEGGRGREGGREGGKEGGRGREGELLLESLCL